MAFLSLSATTDARIPDAHHQSPNGELPARSSDIAEAITRRAAPGPENPRERARSESDAVMPMLATRTLASAKPARAAR